ncbi:MAG: phage tail protein [Myxococcales bacterium]|nr:phage tail protein [Myxococcales bacterium]
MAGRRPFDAIGQFNFKVEIEGVTQAAFKSCDGLTSETEVIVSKAGSSLIERKRPGRHKYGNIKLKRGYVNSKELWEWRKRVMDGHIDRRSGSLIICDDDGSEITRFNFFEAWPASWKSLSLDGKGSDMTVEELEIAYEKLEKA